MSISFRAHCARDHDRQDFTDPAAFEQHMTGEHKARKLQPGGAVTVQDHRGRHETIRRAAPGWSGGKIAKPYPWTAPKPSPGGLEKVAAAIAAGEYTCAVSRDGGWDYAGAVEDAELPVTELRPGDVIALSGIIYDVLDVDPDRGWHMRMRAKGKTVAEKTGWVSAFRAGGTVYLSVTVISRAAEVAA